MYGSGNAFVIKNVKRAVSRILRSFVRSYFAINEILHSFMLKFIKIHAI